MNLLTVSNLKKDYLAGDVTVPALKGISLTIGKGKFISFVGPPGSGKTTLLNLVG